MSIRCMDQEGSIIVANLMVRGVSGCVQSWLLVNQYEGKQLEPFSKPQHHVLCNCSRPSIKFGLHSYSLVSFLNCHLLEKNINIYMQRNKNVFS